jgi:predicted XRE-type DNA-binding protein
LTKKTEYAESTGNVFADLGMPDADTMLIKAELVRQIAKIIEQKALTQAEAAELLSIDQPKVSSLLSGRLRGFSLERIARFLNALGRDVDIVVRPMASPRKGGVLRVLAQNRTGSRAATTSRSRTKV